MSSVKEMVYRVWRRLEGSNIPDDSRYTYRELRGYIISGVAKSLRDSYYEQRNIEDFKYGDDGITTSYKTTVNTDSETGLKYATLDNTTISIAGNRFTSINSINPIGKFAKTYVPIRLEERLIVSKTECVPDVVYFYKDGGKAMFFGDVEPDSQVYVSSRYAIPTNDEAELDMSEEFESAVIQNALAILMPSLNVVSDRENNGVPII